ncbi:MAG: SlyX family protein [Paracoccus sp. (in: a-proteobacteria)]|nr:SlyX family protein [Paracoccus sp. (in: a-proteobacteria)]
MEELSDVVARQDERIRQLERRLGLLLEAEADRLAEQAGSVVLADQRPPHY